MGEVPPARSARRQRHRRRRSLRHRAPRRLFRVDANAETFVGVQIEHIDAVHEVEEIAALPDLDLLFIGPADLSQSMGLPGQWDHPRMWEAVERVARAAKANNVPWAMLPRDAVHARRCVELGCRVLSLGIDVWFFERGLTAFQQEFAEFFPA